MKPLLRWLPLAIAPALLFVLPGAANAHRAWIMPATTVVSGEKPWVTVDAAVSTDVFFLDHQALALDQLHITAPDGTLVKPENANTGKFRSSFDLQLAQTGTYKLDITMDSLFASYKENGELKRWRGAAEKFAKEVPASATDVQISQSQIRVESFVTAGKPGGKALTPTGVGLELIPAAAPTDLFVGEAANFRFLLDGKPAANLKVTLIMGGVRYRGQLNEIMVATDQDGKFSINWPAAGMYWMEASMKDDRAVKPATERRLSYMGTLEVLPQ